MMTKKNYDAVDLMKFVCCILIVSNHSDALYDISPFWNTIVMQGIARLAVPLFFLASAFFLFKKGMSKENVKHYCSRILQLYVIWFVITLPVTIFNRFIITDYPLYIKIWRFSKSIFFTSTFSGSWYLTSCIFCALLFYRLESLPERKRRIITIIISAICYGLCVITSAYGNLIPKVGLEAVYDRMELLFAKPYTSILAGVPYFALARYIVHQRNQVQDSNRKEGKMHSAGAVLLMLLFLMEIVLTYHFHLTQSTDCYLLLLPCSYVIFQAVLSMNIRVKHAAFYRAASTIVFFTHFIWLFMLEVLEFVLGVHIVYLAKFVLGLMLSLASAGIIISLKDRRHLGWLKALY